jgi:hypothetical protein
MEWYRSGTISYENALFYSSNPSEFALRVSGIEGTSDRTFADEVTSSIAGADDDADDVPSGFTK